MKLAVGQRWLYKWLDYQFIMEVTYVGKDVNYADCLIVESNQYSAERHYKMGRIVSWKLLNNDSVKYLEGQDKPIC